VPIYEYQCVACQHALEAIQKVSDSPLRECPACGEPALRKRVSAPAFRLKGGGWYETDFKTGSKKNLAGESGAGGEAAKGGTDAATGSGAATKKSDSAPSAA